MKLNLPEFDIKLHRTAEDKLQVYDVLRAKYVALTPEEWVRQHFVNFLIEYRGYPATFMANEIGLHHNGTLRRCDTVVYDRCARPLAVIEYKSPEVSITERVFDQIVRYNMVMNVRWLMVSNGLRHYCCLVDGGGLTYRFVKDVPSYDSLYICKDGNDS